MKLKARNQPVTFDLRDFAERYAAAWCSQDAASVAACYSPDGSLSINDGAPCVGREAITMAAQEFMTAFPDLKVTRDGVSVAVEHFVFRWTLDGHNTGPDGIGAHVRISGYEEWRIGDDGLIAESLGHFDAGEYRRQIEQGDSGLR